MTNANSDQITSETHLVAAVVVLILVLAFLVLYVAPDRTDQYFAWTITPRTTAILMGAGYMAGAYFFARTIRETKWHRVQAGFPAITAFTISMLAATFLHWNRFHHGTFPFYAWTGIYALTPFLVPFLWWRNQPGLSHELEEHDLRFPALVRRVLVIGGLIVALFYIVIFFRPALLISLTPWALTELTARIFSGWSILTALSVVTVASDARWSSARIPVQSAIVGLGLIVLALPRMRNDFDSARPMTYVFIASFSLALSMLIVIHIWAERLARRAS